MLRGLLLVWSVLIAQAGIGRSAGGVGLWAGGALAAGKASSCVEGSIVWCGCNRAGTGR